MAASIYIGTSGWNYLHWKSSFYQAIPHKDWLKFYAQCFNSVEINGTFYRLQSPETFQHWKQVTPPDFRFSLKANRYLTHNKKLLDPVPSIEIERDRSQWLGGKLSVVLWQLPQSFSLNIPRLSAFAEALSRWSGVRHAIEFRHPSWFKVEIEQLLSRHSLAICQSDAADWHLWDAVTTDLIYVCLHGRTETYISAYSKHALDTWANKIKQWQREGKSVYVYFDNDAFAHAPLNAMQLKEMLIE